MGKKGGCLMFALTGFSDFFFFKWGGREKKKIGRETTIIIIIKMKMHTTKNKYIEERDI